MQRVRVQIDELSLCYIQNLQEDCSFLVFTETKLAGVPQEFLKVYIFPIIFKSTILNTAYASSLGLYCG
ncbi:putative neurolysin/Thimet oligopeptidase, domain 2 [Rosa chinensis]|uniref:Putative neurolysin/Thimet oligopeptidase, domain 2 n=1 Tax=Rosa chinensis TaxID=74649 RepID=A0A2P6R0T5_ROSCH|nr:putative neurolysin/Thimet oligopeptidase, domain 2 [Rosa chinensis]